MSESEGLNNLLLVILLVSVFVKAVYVIIDLADFSMRKK